MLMSSAHFSTGRAAPTGDPQENVLFFFLSLSLALNYICVYLFFGLRVSVCSARWAPRLKHFI
jgi:hypothetical protein